MFESILLVTGHQLLTTASSGSSDGGCGRFSVGSKNVIVFHDVNIASLTGVDLERVKSLSRTENTITKVFASTAAVCPMWVFYTSNERLFKHFVPASTSGTGLSQTLYSHAEESVAKKKVSPENLEAVRARFLEMNVHKTPRQEQKDLDTCGTFTRDHCILGCFDRALETLEKYTPGDFHSAHLPAYIVSSLNKNLDSLEDVLCGSTPAPDCPLQHRLRVQRLREKYNVYLV